MDPGDGRSPIRLADAIRDLRIRAGLSQQDLADRAGLSVGGLRDLEQGRVVAPRPDTLRRVADAMRLTQAEAGELARLSRRARWTPVELRLAVLGPLAVRVDGISVDPGSAKLRALLGLLALTPNAPVGLEALIEAMWEGQPPETAAELVRTHVSRLRQRLQPRQVLVATRGGYQLTVGDDQLDLLEFRRLAAQARRAHDDGDLESAFDRYREATALWSGAPVADVPSLSTHPAVVALGRERETVVVEYADVATVLGRHDRVLPLLREVGDANPVHEIAHARLMIALAATGQQAAALRVFDELRRRLADELGVDPGPELTEAYQRVLRQDVPRDGGPPARPTGPDEEAPAPVSAHRQLPPDIADFIGRDAELRALYDTVPRADYQGTATVISVIEGMAGVGKTRLAVRFAHQIVQSGRYADVQLYVDLHGHADEPPADPATVLTSFLHLLGVPGGQIPADLDGRAALYRDRLHGRPALVILDNAADEQQVLPLLPASAANLVLVTSRRVLALDGARGITLDVFTPQDADALLALIAGRERSTADSAAIAQVAALCGHLPLAVVLAARRLRSRPAWGFDDLAERLRAEGSRLGELAVGTRQIRAVFDLSYRALDPAAQRMFRLLGWHPGDDFTVESAAALAGRTPAEGRTILDRLVDEHLVTQVTADRYRLHDLLRTYASERAAAQDEDPGSLDRVLLWYLYAADAAMQHLVPVHDIQLDQHRRPARLPVFADDADALRWLAAEHANLIATVGLAFEHDANHVAWSLPVLLWKYFDRERRWDDWVSTNRIALAAARRVGDPAGEATTLSTLGFAHVRLDKVDEAIEYLAGSLRIRRSLGDRDGEANVLNNLGTAYGQQGRPAEAVDCLTHCIAIRRELGNRYDETIALNNLGRVYAMLGRVADAIRCLEEAGAARGQLGDPVGLADIRHNLGEVLSEAGRHGEAIVHFREALSIYREKQCRPDEGETLEKLGDALLAAGQRRQAEECWQAAMVILDGLGDPQAGVLRARLHRLAG